MCFGFDFLIKERKPFKLNLITWWMERRYNHRICSLILSGIYFMLFIRRTFSLYKMKMYYAVFLYKQWYIIKERKSLIIAL